ncbi:hypothetical protein FEM48_Zijuj05G0123700 [Ziziphus jujuba var. spinosa]|uniref:PB1 domain-containing protein n=1 Tax=Ziziphus jujuba var. spinosa TaxID=714518 RepID=A0A978VET1_ZIZJJ|nr:hypothetical protein FEM48_Zijuj05G0123700 [Ziziphus jujuba var. spinosa]
MSFPSCRMSRPRSCVTTGGEFTRQLGKPSYVGCKTRLILIDKSVNFDGLRFKMSQLSSASPSGIQIKFQLPNETLDSRLVSVECDDDVAAMLSEFEASQRILVYVFDADGSASFLRENTIPSDAQEFADAEDDLISLLRLVTVNHLHLSYRVGDDYPQASVNSQTTPSTSELVDGRESKSGCWTGIPRCRNILECIGSHSHFHEV